MCIEISMEEREEPGAGIHRTLDLKAESAIY